MVLGDNSSAPFGTIGLTHHATPLPYILHIMPTCADPENNNVFPAPAPSAPAPAPSSVHPRRSVPVLLWTVMAATLS